MRFWWVPAIVTLGVVGWTVYHDEKWTKVGGFEDLMEVSLNNLMAFVVLLVVWLIFFIFAAFTRG